MTTKFRIEKFFANKEIKIKFKSLILNEIDIIKKIINCNELKSNDQIIIRFIDNEQQDYIKQKYMGLNYEKIIDLLIEKYISKEQIVIDVIIQIID